MKILVVDDHATNRKLLRVQLEAEGHAVLDAADGVDALASLEREPVHAVISDILMPRMDGYRLCRAVRQSERFSALPFLLYTSTYDSPSDRQLAATVGADGYILKPAPTSVLLEALHAALDKNIERKGRQLTVHDETDVLRQYSEALVHKLEEKNSELQDALENLRQAHAEILELNRDLEQRVEERTAQLNVAREEAELANKAKSAFLATMSHEIRTPMSGMLGMLELMSLTQLDAEQRETLGWVRESGSSLVRIIDDILDFSKIEAGKLKISPEPASVHQVVEGVRAIFSANAGSKGLSLKCSVDPKISRSLYFDALRLRQILSNFVSNAVKFTARGAIEIKAELVARTDGEDLVRFSVTDTGVGISAEDQRKLFQPFSQVETQAMRNVGGTGLGLTICRQLAALMNGSVEMVSELGKGTVMTLTLSFPIAEASELAHPVGEDAPEASGTGAVRAAPSVTEAEQEGTLVLIVEDSPTNRMLLMRQLNDLGYAAETAENGVRALKLWQTGRFAIVMADCNMPEMDGYELARSIRQLEKGRIGRPTPLLACTASAMQGEAEKCFEAGFDDFLVKPTTLAQLLEKLDQWLPIGEARETSY